MTPPFAKDRSQIQRRQSLWNYVVAVIVSAAMGAGLTWLITSQHSSSEVHSTPPAPSSSVTSTTPDVSGLPPSQAAVVLGNFAYDHERWLEAIGHYEQAIANGIDTADVHTDLGNAFRFSGQPQKALEQYIIAQKLNPEHENSLFNQISLLTEVLNQPRRAVPICEEFIRRFPSSEKLPAVQQELARIRNAGPSN